MSDTFLIICLFLFSQSLIWKISDTVELILVQWPSAPLAQSVEDKTDGGQILSHVCTMEKKTPQNYKVFRRQVAAASEGECRCTTVFLYPIPAYHNHLTTSWPCTLGTVASQSREQPFYVVVSFMACGSYQHALQLQLLNPSKLWIETLVQKEPNPSIFRYYQNCVEMVFFSELSFPWYSGPQELVDTSHN